MLDLGYDKIYNNVEGECSKELENKYFLICVCVCLKYPSWEVRGSILFFYFFVICTKAHSN